MLSQKNSHQKNYLDKIMEWFEPFAFLLAMFGGLYLFKGTYRIALIVSAPLVLIITYEYGRGFVSKGNIINYFVFFPTYFGVLSLTWKDKFIGAVLLFPLAVKLFYKLGKHYS